MRPEASENSHERTTDSLGFKTQHVKASSDLTLLQFCTTRQHSNQPTFYVIAIGIQQKHSIAVQPNSNTVAYFGRKIHEVFESIMCRTQHNMRDSTCKALKSGNTAVNPAILRFFCSYVQYLTIVAILYAKNTCLLDSSYIFYLIVVGIRQQHSDAVQLNFSHISREYKVFESTPFLTPVSTFWHKHRIWTYTKIENDALQNEIFKSQNL